VRSIAGFSGTRAASCSCSATRAASCASSRRSRCGADGDRDFVGSSAALDWNRILPSSVALADHFRRPALPYSVSFNWVSISARFSSTTMIFCSPLRELHRAGGLERPGHTDLVNAQAQARGLRVVDAEIASLAHVHEDLPQVAMPSFASADPSRPGPVCARANALRLRVSRYAGAPLLLQRRVSQRMFNPPAGIGSRRDHDAYARRADVDRGAGRRWCLSCTSAPPSIRDSATAPAVQAVSSTSCTPAD